MFILPNDQIKPFRNEPKREKIKIEDSHETILKPLNFFSLNEIDISQRIQKIPNYIDYFNPILHDSHITLGEIDEDFMERIDEIPIESQILCLKIKKLTNSATFFDFFYNSSRNNSPKAHVLNIVNSYKHFLETIKVLEKYKLVSLNFHPSTIVFKNKLPIIQDFSEFFHSQTIHEERIQKMIQVYNKKNVFLPPEVHIICFLINNNLSSLSLTNVEELIADFQNRMVSLNCLENYLINELKETLAFSLRKYLNQSKPVIIQDILANCETWNNYGISIMFLVLLRDFFGDLNKNSFLKSFSQILIQNIHPLHDKRYNILQNISLFNDILYNTSRDDYMSLFASLSFGSL
jgi:hypothetical protein